MAKLIVPVIPVSRSIMERLAKARGNLVQKKVQVKTRHGTHTRMQWVKPENDNSKGGAQAELFDAAGKPNPAAVPVKTVKPKSSDGYKVYHDSFTSVVDEVIKHNEKQGLYMSENDIWTDISTGPGKPRNGRTDRYSLPLFDKDGKPAKKAVHFQVYDMGKGKYELNMYNSPMKEGDYTEDQVKIRKQDDEYKPKHTDKGEFVGHGLGDNGRDYEGYSDKNGNVRYYDTETGKELDEDGNLLDNKPAEKKPDDSKTISWDKVKPGDVVTVEINEPDKLRKQKITGMVGSVDKVYGADYQRITFGYGENEGVRIYTNQYKVTSHEPYQDKSKKETSISESPAPESENKAYPGLTKDEQMELIHSRQTARIMAMQYTGGKTPAKVQREIETLNDRIAELEKRSEKPTNKAAANTFNPDQHLKAYADSWSKLRKDDVFRVLEEAKSVKNGDVEAMASAIRGKRPDLSDEVDGSMEDLGVHVQMKKSVFSQFREGLAKVFGTGR